MLKRSFSLIFILLLLQGCTRASKTQVVEPPAKRISQTRSLSAFNRINVEGNMNVSLHTGYSRPQVILHGDARDLVQLKTLVSNNQLIMTLGKGYPRFGPVSADIRGRYLNAFYYKGAGRITAPDLHSGLLDLSIDNSGQTTIAGRIFLQKFSAAGGGSVQLSGVSSQALQLVIKDKTRVQIVGTMNLNRVDLCDGAELSLYWVKSQGLIIRASGQSIMQLAGTVDKLDVELKGMAHFKGRYLRANHSFVKTRDKAVAEISAVRHQHSFATDASDIYFYNIPHTRADFMAYAGSVLDMREWSQYDMQVYDPYNK